MHANRKHLLASAPALASALALALAFPGAHAADRAKDAAVQVATAPAAVPAVDPMDQLRQRLTERLSGSKTAPPVGTLEVRIGNKGEPQVAGVPAVARTTSKAKAAPKPAAEPSPVAAKPVDLHWDYNGPAGPQTWGGLKPEFNLCASGKRQSPIDIRGGLAVDLDPIKFNYAPARFGVVDNGHTVQANFAPGNNIEVNGKRFDLVQLHFHRPSEERIDGKQFDMSVHLVHKDEQGRLAVVALLLDKGAPHMTQPALQRVWGNLPLEKLEENIARTALDLNELLPGDKRYFTYMGSLTTPPCSEGVQWVVLRQPVVVSPEQIELFSKLYPMNARPVQQAAGRRILQSQ
jgi:carbonic anhydrase